MDCILYRILRFIGRPIFKILYRPKYIDRINIPKKGPVIIAGNHTSNMDAFIMIGGSTRVAHILSKKELFSSKIKSWFFKSMGCIPVDRKSKDGKSMEEAIKILNQGKAIGIFPEGTINRTKGTKDEVVVLPFKYGTVKMAKETNAFIVPFAITGKYKLFKKGLQIRYGKPYKVRHDIETENNKLMDIVSKMIMEGENERK